MENLEALKLEYEEYLRSQRGLSEKSIYVGGTKGGGHRRAQGRGVDGLAAFMRGMARRPKRASP